MGNKKCLGCLVKILERETLEDIRDKIYERNVDGPIGIGMKYEGLQKA